MGIKTVHNHHLSASPHPISLGKVRRKNSGVVELKIQHDFVLSYCLMQLVLVPAEHTLKYNEGCIKISEANTGGKFSNFYPSN